MSLPVEGMTPLLQMFDMPTALARYRDVLGSSGSTIPATTRHRIGCGSRDCNRFWITFGQQVPGGEGAA